MKEFFQKQSSLKSHWTRWGPAQPRREPQAGDSLDRCIEGVPVKALYSEILENQENDESHPAGRISGKRNMILSGLWGFIWHQWHPAVRSLYPRGCWARPGSSGPRTFRAIGDSLGAFTQLRPASFCATWTCFHQSFFLLFGPYGPVSCTSAYGERHPDSDAVTRFWTPVFWCLPKPCLRPAPLLWPFSSLEDLSPQLPSLCRTPCTSVSSSPLSITPRKPHQHSWHGPEVNVESRPWGIAPSPRDPLPQPLLWFHITVNKIFYSYPCNGHSS